MLYNELGAQIKKRRKALNLSADQLAEKIGVDRATIYRYENGQIRSLKHIIAMRLAYTLNIPPDYFGRRGAMTALEYLQAKKVLTENCMRCTECPLSVKNNGTDLNCARLELEEPLRAIAIVKEAMK